MALLNPSKIEKIVKDKHSKHAEVEASYSIITTESGKVLQLDTYGTSDRKFKGKVSQSIQLDEEGAKWLYQLLKDEYNL